MRKPWEKELKDNLFSEDLIDELVKRSKTISSEEKVINFINMIKESMIEADRIFFNN